MQTQQHRATADKAEPGGGYLHHATATSVHQPDTPSPYGDYVRDGEINTGIAIMVALHGDHRCEVTQLLKNRQTGDVARVQDQVAVGQCLEHRCR